MAKKVNIGDSIDLGKVGYVRLPDGGVVTSGREYIVRHEGLHVAFGNEEVEYDAVDSTKVVKPAVEIPEGYVALRPAKAGEGPEEVAEENQPPASPQAPPAPTA